MELTHYLLHTGDAHDVFARPVRHEIYAAQERRKKIRISSMYTIMNRLIMSRSISYMNNLKMEGLIANT